MTVGRATLARFTLFGALYFAQGLPFGFFTQAGALSYGIHFALAAALCAIAVVAAAAMVPRTKVVIP